MHGAGTDMLEEGEERNAVFAHSLFPKDLDAVNDGGGENEGRTDKGGDRATQEEGGQGQTKWEKENKSK